MARIRTLKPDFLTSPSTRKLSIPARLFFLLLLTDSDDEGRIVAGHKRLAGVLYPHDDDVGPPKIRKWLTECEAQDMIRRYTVDGTDYLVIVNFTKHQRISHPTPSHLPPPPLRNYDGDAPEVFRNGSGIVPESFRPEVEVEREREVEGRTPRSPGGAPESAQSGKERIAAVKDALMAKQAT